jgi:hypothetical protein
MRERSREGGLFQFFPFYKMKYLENRSSKLRTVFTFEIIASRFSKLDPTVDRFCGCIFVFSIILYFDFTTGVLPCTFGFNASVLGVLGVSLRVYAYFGFTTILFGCTRVAVQV